MKRSQSADYIFVLISVLFGFLIRVFPFWDKLIDSPIMFYQPDNSYYVRRVLTIIHNFPHIPMSDIYLSYPMLSEFPSPPFYSLFLAFLSFLAGGGVPSEHTVELVTSFTACFLGAMIAIPVYLFGKKIIEKRLILILCSFAAIIMPLHYWYTNALAGDHHAAEIFFALMAFYYFALLFEKEDRVRRALFVLFMGLLFLVWQGAVLYLGLTVIFLLFYGIISKEYEKIRYFGFNYLALGLFVLFFNLILRPQEELFSYGKYSYFASFSIILISAFTLFVYYLIKKRLTGVIISALVSIMLIWFIRDEIIKGFIFLAKKEKGFVSILEMKSALDLIYWTGKVDLNFIKTNIYFFYLLSPPLIAFFAIRDRSRFFITTLFFVVSFALLTYNQRRFGYIYAPFIVIAIFFFWDRTFKILKGIIGLIPVILILYMFVDSIYNTRTLFESIINTEVKNAFFWLRHNTPPPSANVFDTDTKPRYTVYTPWYMGYYMVHLGQRPVFTNNALLVSNQEGFIDSLKISITHQEDVFKSLLDKYQVKYLAIPGLVRDREAFDFIRYPYLEPQFRMLGILYLFNGRAGDSFLGNFRLIADFINPQDGRKRVKIFEYVSGAKLKAFVGKEKEAEVTIKIMGPFEKVIFYQKSKAGADGYAKFIIPYSSGEKGMMVTELAVFKTGSVEKKLYISEEAVTGGKEFSIDTRSHKGDVIKLD